MIYKNKRKKGITSMKMNLKNKITFNICVIVTLSLVVMCTSCLLYTSFEFPAGWQGKYRIEDKDGTPPYVLVQQKASYEKMGDGLLFGIAAYRDGSYVNLPDYHIWAYDKETVYVMSEPTDVCFYTEDEAVRAEYSDMAASIEAIRKTFRVKEGNAGYDGDQYIFPNSSYIYLKEEDLWNLTQESLRIAKNEIFARHGYQFRTQELAEYFSKRDWYAVSYTHLDVYKRQIRYW